MDTFAWIVLGAILFLLILSGFFSGSETAFTAASRGRLHRFEQQGSRRAATVNRLRAQPERLIGAILLGNNLVNILASALATSLLIGIVGAAGVVYATIAMTLLVLVFGEVLPKSYAIHNADRMALALAPFLRPIVFLLAPITRTVQVIVRATLGLFGVRIGGAFDTPPSEEELRGTIDLHALDEEAERDERAMLHSVLDLADVEVGEIMIHRKDVVTVDADDPPSAIIDQVLASPYTRIPLWRESPDNVVGVLHAKALLREERWQGGEREKVDTLAISTPPWFVPESTSLLDQLHAFRRRREHFALVVDEYGSLMGIVTLEDILEEIVGEIEDEHDEASLDIRQRGEREYLVSARTEVDHLNEQLAVGIPEGDYETLAGFLLERFGRIPSQGDAIETERALLTVVSATHRVIEEIQVVLKEPFDDVDAEPAGG